MPSGSIAIRSRYPWGWRDQKGCSMLHGTIAVSKPGIFDAATSDTTDSRLALTIGVERALRLAASCPRALTPRIIFG